ncbi:MAG: L-fucose:H+ symporter permease [Gemmatimonadaceae bacterium]|nr:L-fucose:H+ symporter permease [Chitinophagaceae bacterium]
MKQNSKYLLPVILVTSLFFLWAFLHNINPILIPHLKKACRLTDTQSSLIDSAVYFGYFLMAMPAGWFMHKYGYKKGIICGLFLYGVGALLFLPAASMLSYGMFLFALFVTASGATFLETVANPYIAKLGDEASSAQRLNFAQSFNGVGAFVAPIIGGQFILSGVEHSSEEMQRIEAAGQLDAYLHAEAATVNTPYLIIGVLVLLLAALFIVIKLPEAPAQGGTGTGFSLKVLKIPQVSAAVLAQLFYVGAQVGVGSFFIRFSRYAMDLPEKQAAVWWSIAMVGFMAGRFAGTFLMKYIRPEKLLAIFSIANIVLVGFASFVHGAPAVYALVAVPFFMSIMFPTIFALGIRGLGEEAKMASSFLVMAIVGGALFPYIMGRISDATGGNIQISYIVPMICFVAVLIFAWRSGKQGDPKEKISLSH